MIKIYVRHDRGSAGDRLSIPLIKHCIRETLRIEGVDEPTEISVLITDDAGIQKLNREYRGMDKPTDVLSFPMQETGFLGDIILSAERVDKQAREYGHSRARETAYLTVHSVLHLLGYDHIDEADEKKKMRAREDAIMNQLDISAAGGKNKK